MFSSSFRSVFKIFFMDAITLFAREPVSLSTNSKVKRIITFGLCVALLHVKFLIFLARIQACFCHILVNVNKKLYFLISQSENNVNFIETWEKGAVSKALNKMSSCTS